MASHVRAFKKVINHWLGLMTHFTSIYERAADDFDDDVKSKAKTNVKFLTNRNSMAILWFCYDVLNIMSRFSVLSQRQYSTIIDQRQKEEELKNSLLVVKDRFGEKLREFLHEAVCENDDGTKSPCDTLERYETAKSVTYKTYIMTPTRNVNQFPLLSTLYKKYIDELIAKVCVANFPESWFITHRQDKLLNNYSFYEKRLIICPKLHFKVMVPFYA